MIIVLVTNEGIKTTNIALRPNEEGSILWYTTNRNIYPTKLLKFVTVTFKTLSTSINFCSYEPTVGVEGNFIPYMAM